MRKLYTLATWLLVSLVSLKTIGQPDFRFQDPDPKKIISNGSLTRAGDNISEDVNLSKVNSTNEPQQSTCGADFEVNITSNSALAVKFSAIPSHSEQQRPVYICWYFGDGKDTCIQYTNTFTGPYPVVHYYQQPGNYEVCIKIVYQGGCEAKACKTITAGEYCKADFERLNLTPTTNPLEVSFRALPSHSLNKKPKQICWRFGDGRDTCIEYPENYTGYYNVIHKYSNEGTYEVCVKILYYGGCEAYKCNTITVTRPDACSIDFERIEAGTTNNSLVAYFKALPWHSNNKLPKQICWNFGDGRDTCIQYPETFTGTYVARHEYSQPGTYQVCVKIIYYGGCESYKCKSITIIRPDSCSIDFERIVVNTISSPLLVYFKALPWHNNNKKPKQICWNFGDGRDTCIQYAESYTGAYAVSHIYRQPGNYQVCLKATYYGGCESYKCKAVQIERSDECKIDFERIFIENPYNLLVAGFKTIPSHNNNKLPKTICWSFGDGKDTCVEYAQDFAGPYVIRHKYNAPGTYTVCIKVKYYGGCEAYICKPVIITRPDECGADFERITVNSTIKPLLVYYKALPKHNNNKKPKQICWSFGDGKDTCIQYPENFTGTYAISHQYRQAGRYEVCVKILYYGGCESHLCKEIIVGVFCQADFERLPLTTANNPLTAVFNALPWHSLNKKPKTIHWSFGDGKDTTIEYPENFTGLYTVKHEYNHPDYYEVCVKIIYWGGCESYKCKRIQIGNPVECKADFERLPGVASTTLYFGFKAIPSHSNNRTPKTICWYFGDGRDTCIQYPENFAGPFVVYHNYEKPGSYEVCVKILYFGGCEAKKCEIIKVEGPGDCSVKLFQLAPSITSLVRGFYAVPGSSLNKRPVLVCWYFGDGRDTCIQMSSTSQLFIRHTYPAPGVYRACVKILFEGGCIAYDCVEVVIRPVSNVCGGFMTDSLISLRTFKFKAFAIHNPDDPVAGYRWTFGDGSASNGIEATHTYNTPGTYEVCLTIKTERGCETRICKKLIVPGNTEPVLHLTPNPVVNILHVQFYSTLTEPVTIRVVNGNGVILKSYVRNATTGSNSWDFDLSTLTAGSYMLYVQSPNQFASQLFIKTN